MTTKLEKKIVALVIVATMVLSSVSAFASTTHVAGTGTVTNPVIAVLLPAASAINVNALQIGSTPQRTAPQISSPWNVVVNRSNVPVAVEVRLGATTGAAAVAATFVDTPELALAGGATEDARTAWLAVAFARKMPNHTRNNTATAPNWVETFAALNNDCTTFDDFDNLAHVAQAGQGALAAMEGGSDFIFLLGAHPYQNNGLGAIQVATIRDDQVAAFTFRGAVNATPAQAWGVGSVSARKVFRIVPLSPVHFPAILEGADDTGVEGTLNVFVDADYGLTVS